MKTFRPLIVLAIALLLAVATGFSIGGLIAGQATASETARASPGGAPIVLPDDIQASLRELQGQIKVKELELTNLSLAVENVKLKAGLSLKIDSKALERLQLNYDVQRGRFVFVPIPDKPGGK